MSKLLRAQILLILLVSLLFPAYSFSYNLTPKTLVLNKKNTIILSGEITTPLVSKLQYEIITKSLTLPTTERLLLIINTPGGSVSAGHRLISTLEAIPQKVDTLVLQAASMGFILAQVGDVRYTTPHSRYMSHRAHLSGISGELGGDLEEKLFYAKRLVRFLEFKTATRLKLTLKQYQERVRDEYMFSGFEARKHNAADHIVLPLCGPDLMERKTIKFKKLTRTIYACPLIY